MLTTRNLLAFIYVSLSLCADVQLFPRRCSCHGGICNCSNISTPEFPTHRNILSNSMVSQILPCEIATKNNCNSGMEITSIDLEDNFFTDIELSAISNCSCVEHLSICKNSIEDLNPLVFVDFLHLREIYLCWNRLVMIDSELFSTNYNLKIVDISNNRLKYIPSKMFEQNGLLEKVHLNNNRIEVLHNNIFNNNPKLKYVDLSNNKLTFIDLVIFKDNTNLEFANFSNNEIEFVENKVYVENCPSEYFDISYNKLNTDLLCKINCKEEPKNIAISGNAISCEVRDTCHSFGSIIVRLCEPKSLLSRHTALDIFNVKTKELSKQRQSESEYLVHRSSSRWKRQDSIVSTTQKSNEFSSDHSPIATRLPFLNISKNVLNTTSSISVITPTQSSINNKTLSDSTPSSVSFLSTIFMYSDNYTSYSEEFDLNVTSTVIPLFEFDSPLVLRESTVRGIMFIVIECSVASVLLLRKVICTRDKRRPPVTETLVLLSEPESRTNRSSSAEESELQTSSV